MSRSLVRTIYTLAKYEKYKNCKFCNKAQLPTNFVNAKNNLPFSEKSCALILAADRLIGYLLAYKEEISIGARYFQPVNYQPKRVSIYVNWGSRNRKAFCAGCNCWQYEECPDEGKDECFSSRFSSLCPRFRLAWAIEHVLIAVNRLIQFNSRREKKA